MQQAKGLEFLDMGRSISRSRSTSMSSDSQLPRIHLLAPPPVNPAPSFIASSAASQIITADQEFNAADFVADDEEDGPGASALIAPQALSALNGFLDHLLFNILATSKSTQLASIRPAVADVLKPRLAREVVCAADEELSEYMGGPEDEEFEFRGGQPPSGEFDLIRSWKLTRLRCMVYTRLGDMEEDDEEEFIAQDGLTQEDDGTLQRFSSHVGNITPAAAIFLTSIIEHIGEQALVIAGETARSRLSAKASNNIDESQAPGAERATMDRLVVEDLDMEKLALNPTLGRLWRTWRKRIRNPNLSRAVSRESIIRRGTTGGFSLSRKSSINTIDELLLSIPSTTPVIETPPSDIDPIAVPLPMSDNDVEEIENGDFHHDIDGAEIVQTMEAVVAHKVRPRSLMVLTLPSPRSPTSGASSPSPITPNSQSSKTTRHARSRSLPNACAADGPEAEQVAEKASPTPSEERKRLETMYEQEEDSEPVVVAQPTVVSIETLEHVVEEAEKPTEVLEESMETAATSSLSAASLEVVTSQASSTHESSTSLSDRVQTDTDGEVIEGQGMAEKPKLTTIQRPKRKSSRITSNNEPPPETKVAEDQVPSKEESVPVQPVVNTNVAQKPDAESTTTEPEAPRSCTPTDNAVPETRPVSTSGESVISERPKRRSKPSPLPLSTGSQQHQGRSSPGLSSASSATERAAVQRLPGKASGSVASSSYARSRRSESISSSRERRPVTAGSTTSQVSSKLKGLINKPTDTPTRLRSSSETSRTSAVTGNSSYDDKSGLDELIRSEETIHYTLTPKTMREMENPDSPRWRAHRSNTADLADFLKNTAPPGESVARPRTSNASARDAATLRKSSDQPKFKPIQIARMSMQPNSNAGQARDAKPGTGSTISSGPDTPSTTNNSQNGTVKQSRFRRFSDAAELSKKFTRSTSSTPSAPRQAGPRPQARSAAIPREDSADLIDFIREGPPSAGAHRIPRTVAPFRDTMDSEDLESLDPANTNTNVSGASTRDGSVATKSMVSAGSHNGLLESSKRASVQTGGATMKASNVPHPVRKQSRVPDPYAIDYDDDYDDDELEELLEEPKPKREEESLMDFLRNVPPPQSDVPPQPFSVNTAPTKSSSNAFGGASAIKSRLLRGTSDKTPVPKTSRTSLRQQPEGYGTNPSSNYTTKSGMQRSAGTLRSSPSMPSVSERQTETSALADFLRSTGPPEPAPTRPTPGPGSRMRDHNNLSRLFVRRKKAEV